MDFETLVNINATSLARQHRWDEFVVGMYWVMFTLPAIFAMSPLKASVGVERVLWFFVGILFVLIIGLRHEIGVDWGAYSEYYESIFELPLSNFFAVSDPAYALVNWISRSFEGGIYAVNLFCGIVVMTGVITFCRRQPLPWIALLIAVPYMIIVMSMNYSRQGVALGFELLALVALSDARIRSFVAFIILGALFHKSAIVLLPLAVLAFGRNRLWTLVWVSFTGCIAVLLIMAEYYESLWQNYVTSQMVSEGGPVRIAMNAVPSVLLILFRKRLTRQGEERRLWVWLAILSLACVPMMIFASTAVDRVALYFMPVQIFTFSRIHYLFRENFPKSIAMIVVIFGYATVLLVWLNFANHAYAWLPYRFLPMEIL